MTRDGHSKRSYRWKLVMHYYKASLIFVLFSLRAFADIEIDVKIAGFSSDKGQVLCAIVTEPKNFLIPSAKAVDEQIVKIKNKKANCRLKLTSESVYAVSVVHDLDSNQKLKTDAFGVALEPWGVSNNAPASSFGPPTFEQAKLHSRLKKDILILINN